MSRASILCIWFSLTLVISLGLYHTSVRVQELGRQLHALNREIAFEQRNIHVLKAEWVFLSTPARIEDQARKHLKLGPTKPQQVASAGSLKKLDGLIGLRMAALSSSPKPQRVAENQASKPPVRVITQAASSVETQYLHHLLLAQLGQRP
ncbi:MAG: hypothetical protein FWF24_04440 [Alphaproteobacteria bacterium]|nr:hypothetical protein [Alphaproteobacteria bacterium]